MDNGRLYKVGQEYMIPANAEAYNFEVSRAGQVGALYKQVSDVPTLE